MCGICGIVNFKSKQVEASSVHRMMDAMKHRGPDDEGIFTDNNTALGFVRLKIIDLSPNGHQPMLSDDGRYVIVLNGEIYNYIELREELTPGFAFRSKTDTEVVLNAFRKWGRECLSRFNGMFAFAVYDRKEKTLFMARDRFGVKPLYYYADDQILIFASEIKPILKVLKEKPRPDEQSIYNFLVYNRTNYAERTFFEGIQKLKHGWTLTVSENTARPSQWYSLSANLKPPFGSADELRETLKSAVELRLRSDVPLGSSLSGGLDSSSIVSIVSACFKPRKLNTFSAVYNKGEKGDETEFIESSRGNAANMFFVKPSAETLMVDIDDFINTLEEPVPSTSIYAAFKVYELAKNHVTVLLDGQGADEGMAGYVYFWGYYYKELLRRFRLKKMLTEMYRDVKNHGTMEGPLAFLYFSIPAGLKDKFILSGRNFLSREFASSRKGSEDINSRLWNAGSLKDAMLYHFEYKLEHLLMWGDKTSMRRSIEVRYPFLDYRIVERVISSESVDLLRDGKNKYILREAVKGIIPESVYNRYAKVGFETPEAGWFRTKHFSDYIMGILDSREFRGRRYIASNKARLFFEKHLSGKTDISGDIWKWINLELWLRKFID